MVLQRFRLSGAMLTSQVATDYAARPALALSCSETYAYTLPSPSGSLCPLTLSRAQKNPTQTRVAKS